MPILTKKTVTVNRRRICSICKEEVSSYYNICCVKVDKGYVTLIRALKFGIKKKTNEILAYKEMDKKYGQTIDRTSQAKGATEDMVEALKVLEGKKEYREDAFRTHADAFEGGGVPMTFWGAFVRFWKKKNADTYGKCIWGARNP